MNVILHAALATAALIVSLIVLRAVFHRWSRALDSRRALPNETTLPKWLLVSARAAGVMHGLAHASRAGIAIALIFTYATFMLRLFPWTRAYGSQLRESLMAALDMAGRFATEHLPNGFVIAIVFVAAYFAIKSARLLFRAIGSKTIRLPGFYPDWADPTFKIARLLILAFAAVVVFHYLPGSSSPAFEGVSLFLGVLVSLGSGSAIAHMVAGTALTYTRAFQVGDRVRVGDAEGDVIEKTLLVTRIRTIKNVEISIPNASVLGHQIVNFSSAAQQHGLILHTSVTIGYDVPWRKVHAHLIEAAVATPHVLVDPRPYVLQTALNDFHATYQVNVYTDQPLLSAQVYSDLHQNIQDTLHDGGVEILSPRYVALRDGSGRAMPQRYLKTAAAAG